jgi:hypothetical protein
MNRSDTRRQVTPGFAGGLRKDDDGDYDGTDSDGFGKVDMPKQARATMGMQEDDEDDVTEGPAPQTNAPPHAMRDAVTNRADEDKEEASEARQKGGVMGNAGRKAHSAKIKGQGVSDAEEMENPARKVLHGREEPKGHEAEIEGAHQGSGDGGEPRYWSNLGHGEREAQISGAHQGQHGGASMTGSGFEAGGRLGKEHARGPSGDKR